MTRARQSRQTGFQAALLLVSLLALFWRVLLPTGFMPAWQGGELVVTLCTEQGLVTAVLDADGTPRDGTPEKQSPTTPCAFASLGLPLLPAAPMALLALALAFSLAVGVHRAEPAPRRAAAWLRPPLRAPPVPAFA